MSQSPSPTRKKKTFPNSGARSTPVVASQQQKVHITHNSTTAVNTTRTGLFAVTTPSSYSHCSQHMRRPMSLATPTSIPDKYGIAAIIPFGKIQEGGAGSQRALEMSRDSQWSRSIEKQRFCFNIAANEVFLGRQNNAHVRRVVEAKKKIDNSCPRGLTIMEEDGRRECTVGTKHMSALEIRRVNAYLRKLRNEHHAHRIALEEEDRIIRGALKLEERGVAAEEQEVASWGPLYFRNKKKSAKNVGGGPSSKKSVTKKKARQESDKISNTASTSSTTPNKKKPTAMMMMPCTPEQFEQLMVDLRVDSDPRTTYRRYLEAREKSTARQAYASDPFREQLQHQHDRMLVEEGDEMLSNIDDVPFSYEVVRFDDTTYIVYNAGGNDDEYGEGVEDGEEEDHVENGDEDIYTNDQHEAVNKSGSPTGGGDSLTSHHHYSYVHRSVTFAASNNSQTPPPQPHHQKHTRPTSALIHRPQQQQVSTATSTTATNRPVSAGSIGRAAHPQQTSTLTASSLAPRGNTSSSAQLDPQQRHHNNHNYHHPQRQRLAPSEGYAAADIYRLERQLERVEAGEPAKVAPVKSVFDCLYDDAKRQHTSSEYHQQEGGLSSSIAFSKSAKAASSNFMAVSFGSSCSRSKHMAMGMGMMDSSTAVNNSKSMNNNTSQHNNKNTSHATSRRRSKSGRVMASSSSKYGGSGVAGAASVLLSRSSTRAAATAMEDNTDYGQHHQHTLYNNTTTTITNSPCGKDYDRFTSKVAELDAEEAPMASDPTRVQMNTSWGQSLQVSGLSPTSTYSTPLTIPRPKSSGTIRSPLNNRTQQQYQHQQLPSPSPVSTTLLSPPTNSGVIRHSASYSVAPTLDSNKAVSGYNQQTNSSSSPVSRTLSSDSSSRTKEGGSTSEEVIIVEEVVVCLVGALAPIINPSNNNKGKCLLTMPEASLLLPLPL